MTDGARELVPMRWGLLPSWWKKPLKDVPATFNARGETVAEKPMFRSACKRTRCIVPASGYCEWRTINGRSSSTTSVLLTPVCFRSLAFGTFRLETECWASGPPPYSQAPGQNSQSPRLNLSGLGEKTRSPAEKQRDQEVDQAYKSATEKISDRNAKVDPWHGMRALSERGRNAWSASRSDELASVMGERMPVGIFYDQ